MERTDEEYALLVEKDLTVLAADRMLRSALVEWGIRTGLGAMLTLSLALHYPWAKWLLATWLTAATIAAAHMLHVNKRVHHKARVIEERMRASVHVSSRDRDNHA